MEWDEDYVKAVHSPLATDDDEYQRVYWTGSGTSGAGTNYPKMASQSVAIGATAFYPSASYRLGIPAPSAAPTTSKSGTPTATQEPDSVSTFTRMFLLTVRKAHQAQPRLPLIKRTTKL